MKKIVFATGNIGKMKEIKEILSDIDCEVLSMKEAGISLNIEENGMTFSENALIKAREVAKFTNAIVLADDSGLEVDYLNKEPGIYSARYMGEDTSYEIKNKSILERLEGVDKSERTARFVCAIAAVLPSKEEFVTLESMEGYIGFSPEGENGFGYDPIFFAEGHECSSATLSMELKNELSHRGKALRAMKKVLSDHKIL